MIYAANIRDKVSGRVLNITVKSNPGHILSPTWDIVMGFKNGRITWDQYVVEYHKLVNERRKTREHELVEIAELAMKEDVYFVCFCADENKCHRTLARDIVLDVMRRLEQPEMSGVGPEGF